MRARETAIDERRILHSSTGQAQRVLQMAKAQHVRGPYFALERVMGSHRKQIGEMDQLIGQKGVWASEEYIVAYKDKEFGWTMITASMVTNSKMVCEMINQLLATRRWVNTKGNKSI